MWIYIWDGFLYSEQMEGGEEEEEMGMIDQVCIDFLSDCHGFWKSYSWLTQISFINIECYKSEKARTRDAKIFCT